MLHRRRSWRPSTLTFGRSYRGSKANPAFATGRGNPVVQPFLYVYGSHTHKMRVKKERAALTKNRCFWGKKNLFSYETPPQFFYIGFLYSGFVVSNGDTTVDRWSSSSHFFLALRKFDNMATSSNGRGGGESIFKCVFARSRDTTGEAVQS